MSDMQAAVKTFFQSPRFAVVGASQDRSKFGFRVLAWYHVHGLPVTPINPGRAEIKLPSRSYPTVDSLVGLNEATLTSVSIITPPDVTRKVLEEAKATGVPAVWMQPGSFDKEGLEYAKKNFKATVGGEGGMGGEGWCVLVDGEDGLRAAERSWSKQKL